MDTALKGILAIVGGIITVAIVAVLVSKKSNTVPAVHALGSFVANVIGAAVNPLSTSGTNGNLGNNPFTTPQTGADGGFGAALNSIMGARQSINEASSLLTQLGG